MKIFIKSVMTVAVLCFLTISCEKEVFIEPKNETGDIHYGKMFISSKPAGALIYINDKYTGYTTPYTIKWLPNGDANIKLKKTNFFDTSFTVRIGTQAVENVVIDYYGNAKMYGNIICKSNPPGAVIYLNNQNTGKITPDTLKRLIPNSYLVKFDTLGYRKDSLSITVESMKYSFASVTLEDTMDILTYHQYNSNIPTKYINDIAEDKNGNIWIATASYGLIKFDGKKFTKYEIGSNSVISSNFVNQVKVDKDNNVWAGFSDALIKYNGSIWEKIDTQRNGVNSMYITDNNTLIASIDRGGILRYQNGKVVFLTKANSGLPNDLLRSVCVDKNGKIWAALGDYGIGVYDGSNWVRLDSMHNGLPYNNCSSLTLSTDGEIIATFFKFIYDDKGRVTEYCPHIVAKNNENEWVKISTSNSDKMGTKRLLADNKHGFWYELNGIKRLIDGNSIPLKDVIKRDLRSLIYWTTYSPTELMSGKGVFIDSEENLWIFDNPFCGLIKIKKGRWNY